MHYHLELIMPPTENIEESIEQILEEYNENFSSQEEGKVKNQQAFYDYWVIGGRCSGRKAGGDIMPISNIPDDLTAFRVIIAKRHWRNDGTLDAGFMLAKEIWNGANWQETIWDGTVKSALNEHQEYLKNCSNEYALKNTPQTDWLCATIDYHS